MNDKGSERLVETLNADKRFRAVARWMREDVVLTPGLGADSRIILEVREGRVERGSRASGRAIVINATDGWSRLRVHGGLQRGFRQGYVLVQRNELAALHHWLALSVIVESLAELS